jgi:hypothetical protein
VEQRELRRAVLEEDPFDLVEVWKPFLVVGGVLGKGGLDARFVALEHEGATSDERSRRLEVAQGIFDLRGRIALQGSARLGRNGVNGLFRWTRTVWGPGVSMASTGPSRRA